MPAYADLAVWKGNTWAQTLRFKQDGGSPLDLTGATVVFRAVAPGVTVRLSSATAAVSIPTPTNGEVTINMAAADTRTLPTGLVAQYEVEMRVGSTQTTILYGKLSVTEWANDDV